MHRLIPMLVRSPLTRVYFETLRMCWVSRVILAPADNSLGGAPMSPIRGAEEGYKGLGRSVRLNVDVAESSESDWDCGSNDAEGGEVLVRSSVSDSFCCENAFGGADVQPSTFFVFYMCRRRSRSALCCCSVCQPAIKSCRLVSLLFALFCAVLRQRWL